jgi:hypothetical protein
MLEEPVLPVGNEVCDICGTTFEDDYQLNQVSSLHSHIQDRADGNSTRAYIMLGRNLAVTVVSPSSISNLPWR